MEATVSFFLYLVFAFKINLSIVKYTYLAIFLPEFRQSPK